MSNSFLCSSGERKSRAECRRRVVDHGDDLLGYLQYQVRPPKIVVNGAAIRAAYQGQGLGTRLLARALADTARQGCDTVDISVQPTNVAVWEMVRLYVSARQNPRTQPPRR